MSKRTIAAVFGIWGGLTLMLYDIDPADPRLWQWYLAAGYLNTVDPQTLETSGATVFAGADSLDHHRQFLMADATVKSSTEWRNLSMPLWSAGQFQRSACVVQQNNRATPASFPGHCAQETGAGLPTALNTKCSLKTPGQTQVLSMSGPLQHSITPDDTAGTGKTSNGT